MFGQLTDLNSCDLTFNKDSTLCSAPFNIPELTNAKQVESRDVKRNPENRISVLENFNWARNLNF